MFTELITLGATRTFANGRDARTAAQQANAHALLGEAVRRGLVSPEAWPVVIAHEATGAAFISLHPNGTLIFAGRPGRISRKRRTYTVSPQRATAAR